MSMLEVGIMTNSCGGRQLQRKTETGQTSMINGVGFAFIHSQYDREVFWGRSNSAWHKTAVQGHVLPDNACL